MRPILSSVLAVLAGALVASACYSEREPPPSFRYACKGDGDCAEGQSCLDGLCETPCTQENFAEVCIRGEIMCLNDVCTSTCDLSDDNCPSAQECFNPGFDLSSGGGSFLGSGSTDTDIGVCYRKCTPGTCGDQQVCLEGLCLQTCMTDDDCPSAFDCMSGVCIPAAGGTSSGSGDGTDSFDNPTLDLSTSDSTGGGDDESSGSPDPTATTLPGETGGAT